MGFSVNRSLMPGTADTAGLDIEISPKERTPLIDSLLRVVHALQAENHKLRDEIDRLKGLPEKPKRPPQPSTLNDPDGKPSGTAGRRKPTGAEGRTTHFVSGSV